MDSKPSAPRWSDFKLVVSDAEDLLEVCGVVRPPVPVFDMAQWLGVTIKDVEDVDYDGELDVKKMRPLIKLNKSKPYVRKRFTVAHELGHLVKHRWAAEFRDNFNRRDMSTRYRRLNRRDWEMEREADDFAARLLVPTRFLDADLLGGLHDPEALAERYQVSQTMMQIRLKTLLTFRD